MLPDPALFDVTDVARSALNGILVRVELEHLLLAPDPRREFSQESIHGLAALLMRSGQIIPCIARRRDPAQLAVVLFDGQRRLLAAKASHRLAGHEGFEGLAPLRSLIVLLLDHDPPDSNPSWP